MNERLIEGASESVERTPAFTTESINHELDEFITSLGETLELYHEVRLSNGDVGEARNQAEQGLARAQTFEAALKGLAEKLRYQQASVEEGRSLLSEEMRALRLVAIYEQMGKNIREYFDCQVDSVNQFQVEQARLDRINKALLGGAANDPTYDVEL